ncbi:MAG: HypC/HybG/HupF family hydrogenase formation chaperone [Proteobacteria bacterium]|nr:HypC/HybG/HupF family hydrogenase formation chaperone [Pseudomonadota bacterium]
MCLAVPSKAVEINGQLTRVDGDEVIREASIMLLEEVKIGDYVIVHAGFTINILHEAAAHQTPADMPSIIVIEADQDNSLA